MVLKCFKDLSIKHIKKILALFALSSFLFLSLYAQEEGSFSAQKSIFLSHEELPSKLYVGQVFPLKVKAIIANTNFDTISTFFDPSTSATVINPDAKWEPIGNSTYENTFYFKLGSANSKLPLLHVRLIQKNNVIESDALTTPAIQAIQLKKEPIFSNVLAQTLSINKYKTTTFDAKNAIIVLEIEATLSNLKEFHLSTIPKNGIDSFSENGTAQKAYYYAIIPNYQKTFEFTYFDIPSNKFQKITLPVVIENEEVSTQLGLNPKESIFEFYKNIAYGVLAFVFFLVFLRRRRFFYFLLMAIFLALFILDKNPLNMVELKTNSTLMILPTERSTVFFTSTQNVSVEKLAEYNNYIKILLPDGKIGWTDRENIIKH